VHDCQKLGVIGEVFLLEGAESFDGVILKGSYVISVCATL